MDFYISHSTWQKTEFQVLQSLKDFLTTSKLSPLGTIVFPLFFPEWHLRSKGLTLYNQEETYITALNAERPGKNDHPSSNFDLKIAFPTKKYQGF